MKPISTGKTRFEIPFDNGDKCILEFNPTDAVFMHKYGTLHKKVGEVFLEYTEKRKGATDIDEVKLVEDSTSKIKALFDEVFGKGAGDGIFRYCSPVSIVDGKYYPFYFLAEFEPDIVGAINATTKESAEKLKKIKEKINKSSATK